MVKFAELGVYAIYSYVLFIFYTFFSNIENMRFSEMNFFSINIGNLSGTAALAYTIHSTVAPMVKCNKK
jgi:sodium-coupled neutral amino acid transporter 9